MKFWLIGIGIMVIYFFLTRKFWVFMFRKAHDNELFPWMYKIGEDTYNEFRAHKKWLSEPPEVYLQREEEEKEQ